MRAIGRIKGFEEEGGSGSEDVKDEIKEELSQVEIVDQTKEGK